MEAPRSEQHFNHRFQFADRQLTEQSLPQRQQLDAEHSGR